MATDYSAIHALMLIPGIPDIVGSRRVFANVDLGILECSFPMSWPLMST
jgi:hypothetical protein